MVSGLIYQYSRNVFLQIEHDFARTIYIVRCCRIIHELRGVLVIASCYFGFLLNVNFSSFKKIKFFYFIILQR
jgi:hypothetical protein